MGNKDEIYRCTRTQTEKEYIFDFNLEGVSDEYVLRVYVDHDVNSLKAVTMCDHETNVYSVKRIPLPQDASVHEADFINLGDVFRVVVPRNGRTKGTEPKTRKKENKRETPEEYFYEIDMSGVPKGYRMGIEIEGNFLKIDVEHDDQTKGMKARRIRLPEDASSDKARFAKDREVYRITVPKKLEGN
ncbi:hypothetical protein M569_04035 [Genlisea aurea]|uniref:SHSP domain-containing protein n=1 Tax=Genlisea aurea TaxID=192259 RepID=S8D051_9LAMI|nr:hypothetical protein M569_04035 [Genlisea aurea]